VVYVLKVQLSLWDVESEYLFVIVSEKLIAFVKNTQKRHRLLSALLIQQPLLVISLLSIELGAENSKDEQDS
jgi:hypothetical protein